MMNELSNEKRFFKKVHPALVEVRHAAKDGLFTVCSSSPVLSTSLSPSWDR